MIQRSMGCAAACQVFAILSEAQLQVAAPPLDPKAFAPTGRTTGLLYPNPVNATCEVLMDLMTRNATASQTQQPTASQVASSVDTDLSLQIENLNSTAFEVGYYSLLSRTSAVATRF